MSEADIVCLARGKRIMVVEMWFSSEDIATVKKLYDVDGQSAKHKTDKYI